MSFFGYPEGLELQHYDLLALPKILAPWPQTRRSLATIPKSKHCLFD